MRIFCGLLLGVALGGGSASAQGSSWYHVQDFCSAESSDGYFSCLREGVALATADAPENWSSSWGAVAASRWGTSYTTALHADLGPECRVAAITRYGADNVLDAVAACSADLHWAGVYDTGTEQCRDSPPCTEQKAGRWWEPNFWNYRESTVSFGDALERGSTNADGSPTNYRLRAISCVCWALVLERG